MDYSNYFKLQRDVDQIMRCFEGIVEEFGIVYAKQLPPSVRSKLTMATVLRWVTEELTCAIQRNNSTDVELNLPIERVNSLSRMFYVKCVGEYAEQLPDLKLILSNQDK